MTPEAQRIAIATACGWTDIRMTGGFLVPRELTGCIPNDSQRLPVPDYPQDLNAMWEAERSVHGDDFNNVYWLDYFMKLRSATGSAIQSMAASADQRAKAFLQNLGLWVD